MDVSESEVAQSCPTLCSPMDYNLSGSSVHGIFQTIALEWIAISFSRKETDSHADAKDALKHAFLNRLVGRCTSPSSVPRAVTPRSNECWHLDPGL